jgi:serine O-acetyltransferase
VRILRELVGDALSIARTYGRGEVNVGSLAQAIFYDGYAVLAMSRTRELARRWYVPGVNRALRLAQMTFYGIEIGKAVELGEGVVFVHTLGTVIGGDARVGKRVRVMGSVTIGTAKDNGYPTIGDDVTIGAGARILGPVKVGDGAVIGANAVVLVDVPPGAVAVGVPATVHVSDGKRAAEGAMKAATASSR